MQERPLVKIYYPFIIRLFKRLGLPQPKKGIYSKPIVSKTNREKLIAFPLKSKGRKSRPFSPYLFNLIAGIIVREISQPKESKGISIQDEEFKASLCANC